ncbi:hypothetical protein GGI00_000736 [Coemansia sp. RSA 2681]|nr:hypothetical protein GGI00_000736 [Coemansia sp. RSA 2681]
MHAFRRSFVYVGLVANGKLAAFGDNVSSSFISDLAATFLPDSSAGPIKFVCGERASVLRGVLGKHWIEFSFIAIGEILLGLSNVWRTVTISRLFSAAGQHASRQELLTEVLTVFAKLVVHRALGLQYQLAKTRLRGQVEGALYLALCQTLVLTPGSTYTSSSLADTKNNLVSPYMSALFEGIAAATSLTTIAGSLALLSADMGWRALGVVLCVLFFLTLSEWVSRRHKMHLAVRLRPKTLHTRIRDILPSLCTFKMLAWEELLFKVRDGDNFDDRASTVLMAAAASLNRLAVSVGIFLSVWLSADSGLGSIRTVSSLQLTAKSCAELVSSVGVIAGLFQLERVLQGKLAIQPLTATALSDTPAISIQNAEYRRPGQTDTALRVDGLSASADQLIGVSGAVGSGKSTLLLAVARELQQVSGTVLVSGSMAYVSQSPWLRSGTIRDNILFGKPFDEEHYSKTTHACCLDDDMAQMALGENTFVGDHGAALSGGQRTRVALAR